MKEVQNRPPGKQLGQGMLIACFIIGIAGLTFFFDGLLGQQINPNQNPQSYEGSDGFREVVLQQNRQGHYVTSGAINGVPVTFLLDTGATDVAIPSRIADLAGLIPGTTSQAYTANGVINVFATTINELSIGTIALRNVSASIASNMPGETILLGMSALRQVEFSQRGSTLTLRHLL
jgi:aspartyl protease family protein